MIGGTLIKALAAALVVAALLAGFQTYRLAVVSGKLATAETNADALDQRVLTLSDQVTAGNAEQRECEAANGSNLLTLHEQEAATVALRAETLRLNAELAKARKAAATALAEDDADDRALESRPDVPPSAELNTKLKARGAGWLWR